MDTSRKSGSDDTEDGEPMGRRMRTLEEKLRIVTEASQPGVSVAAVARKHGVNANLLFGWCRLHRRGLLGPTRQGTPPLLPVKITMPTVTPSKRATREVTRAKSATPTAPTEGYLEVLLPDDVRLRLHGDAQRAVLTRLLEWMPRR